MLQRSELTQKLKTYNKTPSGIHRGKQIARLYVVAKGAFGDVRSELFAPPEDDRFFGFLRKKRLTSTVLFNGTIVVISSGFDCGLC